MTEVPSSHKNNPNENSSEDARWANTYARYKKANEWMESLVEDRTGERYLTPKTQEYYRSYQIDRFKKAESFCEYLGNPQDAYPSIHIAGTSGKGSTTLLISEILTHNHEAIGTHVSPYIQLPNEKIAVNGKMISASEFADTMDEFQEFYTRYRADKTDQSPSYAEAWIAFTFYYFRKREVDRAVVETGMGGRFDPTNIVQGDVGVITSIDWDHVPQLGTSLQEIAWHKAGIIKPDQITILGETNPELQPIFTGEAEENNATLLTYDKDYTAENIRTTEDGVIFDAQTPFGKLKEVFVSLHGKYQAKNAAMAIVASQVSSRLDGKDLSEDTIREGLSSIQIPGRMEILQDSPRVIIDGAHNPQKMEAAAQALKEAYPDQTKVGVLGMLRTKDAKETLGRIIPHLDQLITTKTHVLGKPAYTAEELATIASEINNNLPITAIEDVPEAVDHAITQQDTVVFISGSMYMLDQVREIWKPTEQILKSLEETK